MARTLTTANQRIGIPTPRALLLEPVQQAINNIRERITGLEVIADRLAAQATGTTTTQTFTYLNAQIQALQDQLNALSATTAAVDAPFCRAGVDWVDTNSVAFASGTISCAGWSGGAAGMAVGQFILSAFPASPDDCGIFEITTLDTGANTAGVKPRADSGPGKRFYAGETIYDIQAWIPYLVDEAYNGTADAAFIEIGAGANYLEWNRWPNHMLRSMALRYGRSYSEFNASNTLYAQTRLAIIDATSGALTMTLQAADILLDDWDNRLYAREHILRRIDNVGANTVTVAIQSGEYLDGVLNGTATIAALGTKRLMSEPSPPGGAPQKWWTVN